MPYSRHKGAILLPGFVARSTNSIFRLIVRHSFQGMPGVRTCQRCPEVESVSDVLRQYRSFALHRGQARAKPTRRAMKTWWSRVAWHELACGGAHTFCRSGELSEVELTLPPSSSTSRLRTGARDARRSSRCSHPGCET